MFVGRSGQSENGAVFGRETSLSLSLSRCSHFLAHLCVKFKGLFYSFYRSFISFYFRFCSFYRHFISSCRKFFLFYRSFNSSFHLQKAFFRALCFFKIFKCFVFGFFVLVIARRFCENGVAIHKFSVIFAFWIATLALLARNDGKTQIQIFYSKFKVFYKFNSFHKFISKFKPYTRLFHIFTPNFLYFHSNRFQNFEKFNTRSSL